MSKSSICRIALMLLAFQLAFVSPLSGRSADSGKTAGKTKEGDVVIEFTSEQQELSGVSSYSYAVTLERLMRYYKIPVDKAYLKTVDGLKDEKIRDYGSVDVRMEDFVRFSKKQGRIANLKIKKLYCLNDTQFTKLIRQYNNQAKKMGRPRIDLEGQSTRWFTSGIRKEFLTMDKAIRKLARVKDCKREFVKNVKYCVGKKIPLSWSVALGDYHSPKAGLFLIVGYNDKTEEVIYMSTKKKPQRMKYEDAWSATTGLYTVVPRVKSK